MNDLNKTRIEMDSRRRAIDLGHATRYSEAVDRYLGALVYRTGEPGLSAPAATVPLVPARTDTGVVLVGVDETPTSYIALDHAAIEAELRGCDLLVVHVQRPGGLRPPARDAGARLLERLTDRVHAHSPTVAVTSRLVVGSAESLLLAEARTATLVVVGHRHSTAGTAFGLSVGDRVAAHHTGPVLVVRVPGWPPGPGFGHRPIVVGVDRPGMTTAAAGFALAEARARGCELVVLHADTDATATSHAEIVGGVVVHHLTVAEDPSSALLDYSNHAAAVVLGRHGSTGSPVALLGSVSRTMLQHAYCPVILVG